MFNRYNKFQREITQKLGISSPKIKLHTSEQYSFSEFCRAGMNRDHSQMLFVVTLFGGHGKSTAITSSDSSSHLTACSCGASSLIISASDGRVRPKSPLTNSLMYVPACKVLLVRLYSSGLNTLMSTDAGENLQCPSR